MAHLYFDRTLMTDAILPDCQTAAISNKEKKWVIAGVFQPIQSYKQYSSLTSGTKHIKIGEINL